MAVLKRNQIASWIAFACGCFVIFQGVQHFPMAYDMSGAKTFATLSTGASDFLIMAVLSIGILLAAIGVLSLYFFRGLKRGDRSARIFFLILGILFFSRTLIELNHPVSVPEPNPAVLAIVAIESGLFFLAALLPKRSETDATQTLA